MAWPSAVSGRARRWYMLLRVTWHGVDYRFAVSPLSIPSTAGVVAHLPGLTVGAFSETFQFLSGSVDRQSVPASVLWPDDIAAAVAAGYRLDTAEAELSVWVEGTAYEARRVLLVGRVMQPSYGARGEPVQFSVEAPPWNDQGTWPELLTSPVSFDGTFESQSLGPSSVGTRYRVTNDLKGKTAGLCIGNPGNLNQTKRTVPAAWPANQAAGISDDTRPGAYTTMRYGSKFESNGVTAKGNPAGAFPTQLCLCGHATQAGGYGGDGTQTVRGSSGLDDAPLAVLFNEDGQYVTALVPYHTQLGGRTVTAVNLYDYFNTRSEVRYNLSAASISGGSVSPLGADNATSADPARILGDRIGYTFVSAHSNFDTFYGLNSGRQTGPLKTVHDLLALVLSSSSLPVDWPRLHAALDRIPVFDVEGYVDERVAVWDFVSRELLPLLPMTLRNGPRGLYALTADMGATVADSIGTLRAGVDCFRLGVIQYERRLADLDGVIEVEAGRNGTQPARTVTADGSTMIQSIRARLALESSVPGRPISRVGMSSTHTGQTTQTIKAPWLAGETGAQYVAHQRLAYRSAQIRSVRYELTPEFIELEVGDLVRLVDASVSIDGPAYLSTLSIDASRIVGTFSLYEPVLR